MENISTFEKIKNKIASLLANADKEIDAISERIAKLDKDIEGSKSQKQNAMENTDFKSYSVFEKKISALNSEREMLCEKRRRLEETACLDTESYNRLIRQITETLDAQTAEFDTFLLEKAAEIKTPLLALENNCNEGNALLERLFKLAPHDSRGLRPREYSRHYVDTWAARALIDSENFKIITERRDTHNENK